MLKSIPLLLAILLATPVSAFEADPVIVDVYLAGELKQSVSLLGHGSTVNFSLADVPDTRLEMRLIAPEPVIVEFKEKTTGNESSETSGRVKLTTPGSSVAAADIAGAKFHNPYILVRHH